MPAQSYRELRVWRESMALTLDVYQICGAFTNDERFVLTAQLTRAAISLPSNIAEGARRRRLRPFVLHLEMALGSQAEVEVQLELAKLLGFIASADYERLQERADKIARMLNRLIDRFREAATTND